MVDHERAVLPTPLGQTDQHGPAGPAGEANQATAQFPPRDFGKRAAAAGRYVYVSGAIALTEPGPAAYGIVVTGEAGRVLAQRAHYLGSATRGEATAQALLEAMRQTEASGLKKPVFRIDDAVLADAITRQQTLPGTAGEAMRAMRAVLPHLPGYRVEVIPVSANLARSVALTPLVDWLPQRTRRAEELDVTPLGDGRYAVASESQPGQTYHVTFRLPGDGGAGDGDPIQCECADFLYRGVPCKHLLAVARQIGATERLFYPESPRAAGASTAS